MVTVTYFIPKGAEAFMKWRREGGSAPRRRGAGVPKSDATSRARVQAVGVL